MIKGDTKINSVVKLQTQEVQPTPLEKSKAENKQEPSTRQVRVKHVKQRLQAYLEGGGKTHYTNRNKDENLTSFIVTTK